MKNTILIFTLIIGVSQFGWTQNNKFLIGIDGGLSIANVRGFDQLIDLESIVGYSFSATFQYNFNSKFSLVSGIGFEKKGLQSKDKLTLTDEFGNPTGYYQFRNDINYVMVPLMARYTFGEKKFKGFASLGGYIGALVESYTYLVGYEPKEESKVDYSSNFENIDLGVSVGLGASYAPSRKFNLTIEIRNNLGLYNVSSVNLINDGEFLLNSTNFLFGVSYGLVELRSEAKLLQ